MTASDRRPQRPCVMTLCANREDQSEIFSVEHKTVTYSQTKAVAGQIVEPSTTLAR